MEYLDEVSAHITHADFLLKSLVYSLSPLYKEDFGTEQDVVIPLFTGLHSTSESILILLLHQALFDADVLLRSVMEGTIKFCYLMRGTSKERHEKYIEYKIKLTEIDRVSDHYKAIETVEILREFSTNSTKTFEMSILEQDELESLQKRYPRKIKNELKQKWCYQALLRDLAHDHVYKAQLGTLSTYALSSHFCHYDWIGVSSIQTQIYDNSRRGCVIFDIGHAIRIIANVMIMETFRVTEYMRGNKYYSKGATALLKETLEFACQLGEQINSIIENEII